MNNVLLRIEPLALRHAAELRALLRHEPAEPYRVPRPAHVDDLAAWLEQTLAEREANATWTFVVRDPESNDAIVGTTRLRHAATLHTAQLSYWIARPCRRRTLGTRAVQATIAHAHDVLAVRRIQSLVAVENEPSRALLERLRFVPIATLRDSTTQVHELSLQQEQA